MRRIAYLFLIGAIAFVDVRAQTSAADGVEALVRGDYLAAIQILRPLAEQEDPNPVALFFMGVAYQSGAGVPRNDLRACEMYSRAASRANPLMVQAAVLAEQTRQMLGPQASRFCNEPFSFPDPPENVPSPAPSPVSADALLGVRSAVVEGGDARAYAILAPLGESSVPDDVAAFFLAGLYEAGRGAPLDEVRACALYHIVLRRSANGLFAQPTAMLGRHLAISLGQPRWAECQRLANRGLDDQGIQRTMFTLGPGHTITVDSRQALIAHDGREKRIDLDLGTRGSRFMPIRHTELDTLHPSPSHRHFLQFLWWAPRQDGRWKLCWGVWEIAGDAIVFDNSGEVLTASTPELPLHLMTAVARGEVPAVRVDENGNAELVVDGDRPYRQGIPAEAERQEDLQWRRARTEADQLVDWTTTRDVVRLPTLTYVDSEGCYDLFVYGWSSDRTEAIAITARNDSLHLSSTPKSFDLAAWRPDLSVTVHVFDRAKRSWPYCTDVVVPGLPEEEWRAVAGTAIITASEPLLRTNSPRAYRATVTLENAVFAAASGRRVQQTAPITLTAITGRFFR